MRREEIMAEALLVALDEAGQKRGIEISFDSMWSQFDAVAGERKCTLFACVYHHTDGHEEYTTSLFESGEPEEVSGMRTSDPQKIVSVSIDWLAGASLEEIYDRYSEVDVKKRRLQAIDLQLVQICPLLQTANRQVTGTEIHGYYSIGIEIRSCNSERWGANTEVPKMEFCWDQFAIAEMATDDLGTLALAIQAWIMDRRLPSEMASLFLGFKPNGLAAYFEEGRGMEGVFRESWDKQEHFYLQISDAQSNAYIELMRELRLHGYDKTLRAGSIMIYLCLSRAKLYGMLDGDAFLQFDISNSDQSLKIIDHLGNITHLPSTTYDSALEAVLRRLESAPIT